MKILALGSFALLALCGGAIAAPIPCGAVVGNVVQNCSFETNNVGSTGGFGYSGSIVAPPWTFTGRSGLSGVSGPFGNGTVDGSYDAFLQQYNSEPTLSTISQALTLSSGTSYTLSAYLASRTSYPPIPVNIYFGATLLGTVNPGSSTPALYTFVFNTATTGTSGNLTFQSSRTDPNDTDTVLDNVSLSSSAVPEPATFGFVGAALIGLAALRQRRG